MFMSSDMNQLGTTWWNTEKVCLMSSVKVKISRKEIIKK